jgi:hypothetical protein
VDDRSSAAFGNRETRAKDTSGSALANAFALLIWLAAAVVAFIPFAFDTSPWDAVTLRVPGNQGNWWHFLAGAPFFLAYPMIWLRLRSLFSAQSSTAIGRRLIWCAVAVSTAGTILVMTPFMLHLAGTRGWPSLSILSVGFGILIASAVLLFLRRHDISPTRACLVGLDTAYLANAALCLVVYAGAAGNPWSKAGWLVTMVIVWPIVGEIFWLFIQTFRTHERGRRYSSLNATMGSTRIARRAGK